MSIGTRMNPDHIVQSSFRFSCSRNTGSVAQLGRWQVVLKTPGLRLDPFQIGSKLNYLSR